MTEEKIDRLSFTDSVSLLVEGLRAGSLKEYGYDLYVSNMVRRECGHLQGPPLTRATDSLSRKLSDAAWELCVRGLVRPGVRNLSGQSTDEGGYSITDFGKRWLREPPTESLIVADSNRVTSILEQAKPQLGEFAEAYYSRGVEATRCYQAHAFLATCVMAGAAAESVLLALATSKHGDRSEVLRTYASAQGRSRVEKMILGQATDSVKKHMNGFLGLLKEWRDDAAHGAPVVVSADEAATSLDLLVRFSLYAAKNWRMLTT